MVPEVPRTSARSLAIGSPPDGVYAAQTIRQTGGGAAAVPDEAIVSGIRTLAEDVGVFAETAGGVTVAAALQLAADGRLGPDDEVVLCITGNGFKTVEAIQTGLPESPIIAPKLQAVVALVEEKSSHGCNIHHLTQTENGEPPCL